ncbi:MAG: hypothetical protein M3142_07020, partial [Bacteroidota bacterium]|nr:hypothetical protein [Bacteroidota bacterium]
MWEHLVKNITSNPKPYRIGAELFIWVIIFLFPAVFFRLDLSDPIYLLDQLLQTLLFACIYYLATLVIIPAIFSGKILKFIFLFLT